VAYHNCNASAVFPSAVAQLRAISRYKSLLTRCSTAAAGSAGDNRWFARTADELSPSATRRCCLSVANCDACVQYQPHHPQSVQACDRIQLSDVVFSGGSGLEFDVAGCVDSTTHYNTAELVSRCCLDSAHSRSLNWTVAEYLSDLRRRTKDGADIVTY